MMAEAQDWSSFGTFTPEHDWSQFGDFKSTAAETATGIAKAAGVGVAKGAIGLAGLPGDVSELAQSATEKLGLGRGLGRNIVRNVPVVGPAMLLSPTSGDIQGKVEGITGEFRKPEGTAEEVAQTIGEFLPAGMAGPAGLGRKAAFQVVAPALTSEAAGRVPGIKGTEFEPYVRAAGGMAGGVAGGILARPGSAAAGIRSQLPEYVTEAHVGQAEALMNNARQQGINLTWPEALSQVTNRPVLSDMQRILESTAESRPRMQEFFADRPQQIDIAAQREFNAITPPTAQPSAVGRQASEAGQAAITDARGIINTYTDPFYRAAEGIRLTPQEMGRVRALPGYQEARDAIRNDPQLNRYVSHLPDDSVGFLNEVKKYFDQQGTNATSKFNPTANQQRSAGYGSDAASVRQAALDAADRVTPPGTANPYEVALNVQEQTRRQYLQPLIDGPLGKIANQPDTKKAINALFPSNPLSNSHNEIDQAVSALSARNPWAARQLVRGHAEMTFNEAIRDLQSGQNQFGGAKFAVRLTGNPQQRENLRAAVEALPNGQQTWAGFENFLNILEATGTRQQIGSRTAFNAQELKALASGGAVAEAVKTGASPGKWMSLVNDKISQWQYGSNLRELANIITNPAAGRTLRRIANMPPNSDRAAVMAGRLIAQTSVAGNADRMRVTVTPADKTGE